MKKLGWFFDIKNDIYKNNKILKIKLKAIEIEMKTVKKKMKV